jgi:hypothetical protein
MDAAVRKTFSVSKDAFPKEDAKWSTARVIECAGGFRSHSHTPIPCAFAWNFVELP